MAQKSELTHVLAQLPKWLPVFRELLACPSLQCEIHIHWASESVNPKAHSQHRQLIRTRLSEISGMDLTEPSRRPHAPGLEISISHCPLAGGFALCDSQNTIGFDLEEAIRLQDSVVKRVSQVEEFAQAPSPAHLWVAKEAAFKSLAPHQQPSVLSKIAVRDWLSIDPNLGRKDGEKLEGLNSFYSYHANAVEISGSHAGKGLAFSASNLFIAFFAIARST